MPPLPLIAHRPYQPRDRAARYDIPPRTPSPIFGLSDEARRGHPQARPISISIPPSSSFRLAASTTTVSPAYPASAATSLVRTPPSLLTPAATAFSHHPILNSPIPSAVCGRPPVFQREGLIRAKSFPHTADLLGNPRESSNIRAESRMTSPVSLVDARMESADANIDGTDGIDEGDDPSLDAEPTLHARNIGRPISLADILRDLRQRRQRQARQSRIPSSQQEILYPRSTFPPNGQPYLNHEGRYHASSSSIRPRSNPSPTHFAAFDHDTRPFGLNELGLIRDRYIPSAHRQRAEFVDVTPNHARSTDPFSTNSSDTSDLLSESTSTAQQAQVGIAERRPRQVSSPLVVSPMSRPLASAQTASSSSNSSASERHARRSHRSSFAGMSQPRSSHRTYTTPIASLYEPPALPYNRSVLSARDREQSEWDSDAAFTQREATGEDVDGFTSRHAVHETFSDPEAREEERSIGAVAPFAPATIDGPFGLSTELASRYLRERLARLDAVRTQPARHTSLDNSYEADAIYAPLTSTRDHRPMLRPRETSNLSVAELLEARRMDIDEPAGGINSPRLPSASIRLRDENIFNRRDESSENASRDRDLQAIYRRFNTNRPRSPASSRHYRDSALPYALRRSVAVRRDFDEDISTESDAAEAYRQPWGEIPVDVAGGRLNDPMVLAGLHGLHDRPALPSLIGDNQSRRPFRLQRSFGTPERSSNLSMTGNPEPLSRRTGERRGFGDLPPLRAGRFRSQFDEDWLNSHNHEHSPQSLHNAAVAPVTISGGAHHLEIFSSLQLDPNMGEVERATVVGLVAKGVTRWPSDYRRMMAENMLEHIAWADIGPGDGMLRDEYCSVCHDEVSLIRMVL